MSKQVPEAIRQLSRERAPRFYQLRKTAAPSTLEVGQIWSTLSAVELPNLPSIETDEPRLLVILSAPEKLSSSLVRIMTAPISLAISMATDFDLIVREHQSPLTFPFMVEVWNEVPVLNAQLNQYLGSLSSEVISVLQQLQVVRLSDESIPDVLANWVGIPLAGENDSRIAFQQSEIEAVDYLAEVATAELFVSVSVPADKMGVSQNAQKRRFEILPQFGRIVEYLKSPQVAFAADALTGNEMIVAYSAPDAWLTFELLFRKKDSTIYLIAHDFSSAFEGKPSTVTVVTADAEYHSGATALHKGVEIIVGHVPAFNRKQVQKVVVEIEE